MTKNGARKPGRPAVGVGDEAVCGAANDDATATETSDVTPIEVVASERPSTEAVELQQVELQQEVSDLKGQLQRKQAELINFRRRTQKEQAANAVKSRGEMVLELLPIIDDFERAVSVKSDSAENYRQGMELILRTLHETLRRIGIRRLDPLGETFDPQLHEAVDHSETDEVPDGQIMTVFQPGYRLEERLLRPAMVTVAKKPVSPRLHTDVVEGDEPES